MLGTENKKGGGKKDKNNTESHYLRISKFAAAGLEFPSTILGGLFLGYTLDNHFKTSPWFTAILTVVALVGAFIRLFQWINYLSKKQR